MSFNSFDSRHDASRSARCKSGTYSALGLACALPSLRGKNEGKRMLKISIIDNPNQCRLVLEGKLVGPWAAELRTACAEAKADPHSRELIVDMKHLTAISQEGENVLLELMNNGIKFRGSGVFTKEVLKQLSRRATTNLRQRKGNWGRSKAAGSKNDLNPGRDDEPEGRQPSG